MRDLDIHDACMKAVDSYTGTTGNSQPRYKHYPYPQRLQVLSNNLRVHVLRESGDFNTFLTLQEQVFNLQASQIGKLDNDVYDLIKWLKSTIDLIPEVTREENTHVHLVACWGEKYTKKMLNYCFPSLMADGNFPALTKEKRIIVYVATTELDKAAIQSSNIYKKMVDIGILFDWVIIPKIDSDVAYWALGAVASLGLHYAKIHHASFHHSYPDIVYSGKFFSEMLRLSKKHRVILGSGMRSDETLMMPKIKHYAKDCALDIPCADLVAHHLDCIHPVAWGMMVNNRPAYWMFPESHVQIWESEAHMHINSPHVMAHWLDAGVVSRLPTRYYQTLDSEMDLICEDRDWYMICDDEAYQAELSAPDRQHLNDSYCHASGVAAFLWGCITHRDTAKFFFSEMRLPINREIRPASSNVIPISQVETLQRFLYNEIVSSDRFAGVKLARKRTHEGWIFQ